MSIKKELFNIFSLRSIYLPEYALENIHSEVKERMSKGESFFSISYELEKRDGYEKYSNPIKGAYAITKERDQTKKAIIRIDKDGEEKKFESLYAAALAIGKNKDACGNISKACKGKYKTLYGYKWRFDI